MTGIHRGGVIPSSPAICLPCKPATIEGARGECPQCSNVSLKVKRRERHFRGQYKSVPLSSRACQIPACAWAKEMGVAGRKDSGPTSPGPGSFFCRSIQGLSIAFPWGHAVTPKTLPLAPCEFSLVTEKIGGVIREVAGYQSDMAVSGLAGVLRVVRRGGFNHQPV